MADITKFSMTNPGAGFFTSPSWIDLPATAGDLVVTRANGDKIVQTIDVDHGGLISMQQNGKRCRVVVGATTVWEMEMQHGDVLQFARWHLHFEDTADA